MLTLREKHEYEHEIEFLKASLAIANDNTRKALNSKNEWHCKYRAIAGIKLTTAGRLRILVKESKAAGFKGNISNECKRIAKVVGVSWRRAHKIWYEKEANQG